MNPEESPYCSHHSISVREPLFGTAPRTDVWLLIEYSSLHASKAFEGSDLSEPVKNHLAEFTKNTANARLVLIKRSIEHKTQHRQLFVAASNSSITHLHHFELNSYEEITDLDFYSIAKDAPIYSGNRYFQPVILVCTNGKRDRCCAKYGLPLYEKLTKLAPGATWQSSHVGGHRFAPNVICLPAGIYYGRLSGEDVEAIVRSANDGTILLDHYRGRASYPSVAQAAEFYLRGQTGILEDSALHLIDLIEEQKDQWIVKFGTNPGDIYDIFISIEESEFAVLESCSAPEKRMHQPIYYLKGIQQI